MFMIMEALWGIGIFLFGMYYLESAIKEASGAKFRRLIRQGTSNTLKALSIGAGATAILQSSSVVSLMALSFVGAGLLSLQSTIGIIYGSNLGTTFTAWIIAALGFKIKIDAFALPMAGVGGLLVVFFKNRKRLSGTGKILVGFGLLFLGLDYLKSATDDLSAHIDLTTYSTYPVIFLVLAGTIMTAIIQSSSAMMAIILSGLHAGIIDLPMGAALVIGSNIGTTVTAILGAIGGSPDKKRAATAHFFFNVITATVALLILPYFISFVSTLVGSQHDETITLALFHTVFNLIGIVLLSPFIGVISKLLEKLFRTKTAPITKYIDTADLASADAGFEAMKNETRHLFDNVLRYILQQFAINPKDVMEEKKKIQAVLASPQVEPKNDANLYCNIKKLEMRIKLFGSRLGSQEINPEDTYHIQQLQSAIRESTYAAKLIKDVKNDLDQFKESDNTFIQSSYTQLKHRTTQLSKHLYLLLQGESQRLSKAGKIKRSIQTEYDQLQNEITNAIKAHQLSEEEAGSLLNANQAINLASDSLFEASLFISGITEDSLDDQSQDTPTETPPTDSAS